MQVKEVTHSMTSARDAKKQNMENNTDTHRCPLIVLAMRTKIEPGSSRLVLKDALDVGACSTKENPIPVSCKIKFYMSTKLPCDDQAMA